MFTPKTDRIKALAVLQPHRIQELEGLFDKTTNIYIDFANAWYWQEKLGWHIDIKRMKQFIDSFSTVKEVKFYNGELAGNSDSCHIIKTAKEKGYTVKSKAVKIIDLSINVSSVSTTSPEILKQFIRAPLLQKLKIETVEYLNNVLKELNKQGILKLQDRKCNFDVEISVDMILDCKTKEAENFVLMSGDSDFYDPIEQLIAEGKRVILFSTARRVSRELNSLTSRGLLIYDIQKMREFICFQKEITILPKTP